MEGYFIVAAVAALALVALFTRRLDRSVITLPIVCVALGIGFYALGGASAALTGGWLTKLAEVTLAVVLFTDAAHLKVARLNRGRAWAIRLLMLGAPLAFCIGLLVFLPLFPDVPIWQIALLAALLVPTDAALGLAVVKNEKIPVHVRDTLTAESGLNDGLLLPLIIFLACAAVGFDHELSEENWYLFAGAQIGFGIAVGVLLGTIGGIASQWSVNRGYAVEENTAIFSLALIALTYLAADGVGGNSFVAVFTAGLAFGRFARDCAQRAKDFLESEGGLLIMVTFFAIGAFMLPEALDGVSGPVVTAVALSLLIVRPLAVLIAMWRTKTDVRARLFMGWFGPRGLATALFTLIILEEFGDDLQRETLLAVAMTAFLASTVLHGVTAHFAKQLWGR